MFLSIRVLALLMFVAGLMPVPCAAKDPSDTQEWETSGGRATARAYYRAHAQVILGPEHRLSNGVAWRLHIDAATGMKQPRITWMSDAKRQRTANKLFEGVHGEDMRGAVDMFENPEGVREDEGQYLQRLFANKGKIEPKPSTLEEIESARVILRGIQQDVDLTYASVNLVSAVSVVGSNLSRPFFYPEGVTFDLARGTIHRVMPCNSANHYDYGQVADGGPNYLFRFGPLLRICDQASYRAFKRLYAERAAIAARIQAPLIKRPPETAADSHMGTCLDQYIDADKYPNLDYEFTLYLTFKGLAAHRSWFESALEMRNCTFVTPLNPTIIPWRDLEPLMQPGPWRDELLALQ
jgi:hypothetical protein